MPSADYFSFWPGMDPYPLQGWRWIDVDGEKLLESPQGQRCETTVEALDLEMSTQKDGSSKTQLAMIQQILNECCSEKVELNANDGCAGADGDDIEGSKTSRQTVTTGPLDDWLWCGDHPILKDMHWYLYSMWVYRVEVLPLRLKDDGEPVVPGPRFIDIDFSPDYKLHRTHKQRIATEFRIPLYEGFTMPPSTRDSETAAMYKSLLLRGFSIKQSEESEDVRFALAFDLLCLVEGEDLDGNKAAPKGEVAPASHCQNVSLVFKITCGPALRFARLHSSGLRPKRSSFEGHCHRIRDDDLVLGCRELCLPGSGFHAFLASAPGQAERLGRGSRWPFLGPPRVHELVGDPGSPRRAQ